MDIEMKVTLDPSTGIVTVNGPIENEMLCYGMLTKAEFAIREHHQALAKKANGLVAVHGQLTPIGAPNGNGR